MLLFASILGCDLQAMMRSPRMSRNSTTIQRALSLAPARSPTMRLSSIQRHAEILPARQSLLPCRARLVQAHLALPGDHLARPPWRLEACYPGHTRILAPRRARRSRCCRRARANTRALARTRRSRHVAPTARPDTVEPVAMVLLWHPLR